MMTFLGALFGSFIGVFGSDLVLKYLASKPNDFVAPEVVDDTTEDKKEDTTEATHDEVEEVLNDKGEDK